MDEFVGYTSYIVV